MLKDSSRLVSHSALMVSWTFSFKIGLYLNLQLSSLLSHCIMGLANSILMTSSGAYLLLVGKNWIFVTWFDSYFRHMTLSHWCLGAQASYQMGSA